MPDVYLEGRKTQQHRIEHLVRDHLMPCLTVPDDYCKTELEKTMQVIIKQFIDSVRDEGAHLDEFQSIYL